MDMGKMIPSHRPCSMVDLSLPATLKVLVLAPHPDDFDAIGVTLKLLSRNGNPMEVAVARSGSGVEDVYPPDLTISEKADIREREQRHSIRFFGLPDDRLTFLRLANDAEDQLIESPENHNAIQALVKEKAPDIVLLPHGNDTNSAHRAMYSMFVKAAREYCRPLLAFLSRDPKTIKMRFDLYTPFGREDAEWKGTLLRFHDSQHQRNLRTRSHGFDDRILDVNRAIARELNLTQEYAEVFEIERYNMPERTASS